MNFRPSLWKIIVALVFALPAGYIFGVTGLGFRIGDGLIGAVPIFIFVYLVGSFVEKNKVSQK